MRLTPEQEAKAMLLDLEFEYGDSLVCYRRGKKRVTGWMVRHLQKGYLSNPANEDAEAWVSFEEGLAAALNPGAYNCEWDHEP